MERLDRLEIARRDGFLFWPDLFDRRSVEALRDRVVPLCERFRGRRGLPYDDPDFVQLQCEVTVLEEFDRLRRHPPLLDFLVALFAGPVLTHQGDVCRIFFPNAPEFATPAHQDEFFLRRGTECWSVWTPLVDCPLALGPLELSPGSHRLGLLNEIPDDLAWWSSPLHCGDALLIHHLTIHRALPNVGTVPRLSIDCRYRGR